MSGRLSGFKERLYYYLWASFRRRSLDELQERFKPLYRGIVLDIGGRDRGAFRKPRQAVEKWVHADISPEQKPDIILDVADMKGVEGGSMDVVNAIELFEHVDRIDSGIRECHRVLSAGGVMLIAVPFLFPVHADPYDFQRWTDTRWRLALQTAGFLVEELVVMGRFFTVWADMARAFIQSRSGLVRKLMYLLLPLLDLLVLLDKTRFVLNDKTLSAFHGGYFIVCRKPK